MSHLVTIQSKVHDPVAIRAACRRMSLAVPVQGTASLFSGQVSGLLLQLPDWQYPVVLDTLTGAIHYDNFEGRWGNQQNLDLFLQSYAVEKAILEAQAKGLVATEQQLQDGSILVQIREGY